MIGEQEKRRAYRFDELGGLQFERLCLELLAASSGIESAGWLRSGAGSARVLAEGVRPPGQDRMLRGPTLVLVVWLRPADEWRLASVLEGALEDSGWLRPRSLLVLTNVGTSSTALPDMDVVLLGPLQLTELVDRSWQLRLRVPTVLGIGAAEQLARGAHVDCSTGDLAAAHALAPLFVGTRAYAAAIDVLARHRFVVLTGPPEMGKTAIARTLGLAALTDGWELHECVRAQDLWAQFRRDCRQLFIADDAFGSTEYQPEAADRWALELDRILQAMDDKHWLVWTSRPAPLKAGFRRIHREHGIERFPDPARVQVDAADLDLEEKALILFRHTKAASLPRQALELVKTRGWSIVSHPHFTPERIRRFVTSRLPELSAQGGSAPQLEAAVAAEIREPTSAMATSLRALSDQHRALLVALLDTKPGPTGERELAAAFRRHNPGGMTHQPAELVDRLADHFLRRVDDRTITWVHPSWRDLVIEHLSEHAREREHFLRHSALDGLLLALSTAGGAEGTRQLPLIRTDRDWDTLADRLRGFGPSLDERDLTRLILTITEARSLPEADRSELDFLTTSLLQRLANQWAQSRQPITLGPLQSWLELAATLPNPPARPELTATWIELAPTGPISLNQEEILRLDEWTSLCELLHQHAPDTLTHFGFPYSYREHTEAFLTTVAATARIPAVLPRPQRHLLASILWRLNRLNLSDPGRSAHLATRLASTAGEPELPETFAPREISAELKVILNAPPVRPRAEEALVARVLDDLY